VGGVGGGGGGGGGGGFASQKICCGSPPLAPSQKWQCSREKKGVSKVGDAIARGRGGKCSRKRREKRGAP